MGTVLGGEYEDEDDYEGDYEDDYDYDYEDEGEGGRRRLARTCW